jgi:MFS family permease
MRSAHPRLALALVIVEGFLGRLTFGMVSFALPLYALSLGLSLGEIGLIVSFRTVIAILLKPVAGWLADRLSVRAVYLGGTLARALAAAALLLVDGLTGLAAVRFLQGASAAGRDIASLGVIARDAAARIGSVYSWYTTAKHIGGVAGAGIAGLVLAASAGSFTPLFALIVVLSVLPTVAVWLALKDAPEVDEAGGRADRAAPAPITWAARWRGIVALARELHTPASVGMLVATSAYMVHGLFPVLATEYAGLNEVQTGAIYSLSAFFFLVSGPAFGWAVDRYGHAVGMVWRSLANIGSSLLYMLSPTLVGLTAARSFDDSGKAAFRPAWAAMIGRIANADPARRGRRLGLLDTSETVGEAVGPALAGLLWQTGGIGLLFGVRIAIAAVAELLALRMARAERQRARHAEMVQTPSKA